MAILTEPIGSIPRTAELLEAMRGRADGRVSEEQLHAVQETALRDTITRLEETGSPVISDGEQTKPSFVTYPLEGLSLAPDGITISFADGHTRQLPRLTAGPFRYGIHAVSYLKAAQQYARAATEASGDFCLGSEPSLSPKWCAWIFARRLPGRLSYGSRT